MTLQPGDTVGAYRITAQIGVGGMGEVYRASDARLGRAVAIKVLPSEWAVDRDRMARFHREAQVLASLNHPHIAQIYGFEESPAEAGHHIGTDVASGFSRTVALVMELVEGPTLGDRIHAAPTGLPIEDVLNIARQIAEALEYAHERGIVHRDLKPANIKITPDGQVKVLDFGLAKALDRGTGIVEQGSGERANSPTLSLAATAAGMILGTAAYMAPEQAKGKAVDRRADIWAFGVIVYEMLTGRMAFVGETASETMAFVMTREPAWAALPAETPARVTDLLRRCFVKDPRNRARDIGDLRIAIEEIASGEPASGGDALSRRHPATAGTRLGRTLPWAIAVASLAAAVTALWAPVALGVTAVVDRAAEREPRRRCGVSQQHQLACEPGDVPRWRDPRARRWEEHRQRAALRPAPRRAAGDAPGGDRGRAESVLLSGRPVDRLLRRG